MRAKFILTVIFFGLSFLINPSQANATECLSQFPDSYWNEGTAGGDPLGNYGSSNPIGFPNNVVLYKEAVTVSEPNLNLRGIYIPFETVGADAFLQNEQVILEQWTYGESPIASDTGTSPDGVHEGRIDQFVRGANLYSFQNNVNLRSLPIDVTWTYKGETCGTRVVTIHRDLEIKPMITVDITKGEIAKSDLDNYLKFYWGDFIQRSKVIDIWNGIAKNIGNSAQAPYRIIGNTKAFENFLFQSPIFPKRPSLPNAYEDFFKFRDLGDFSSEIGTGYIPALISEDNCIIGGNLPIGFNPVAAKISAPNTICKVQAHWFVRYLPKMQIVADIYIAPSFDSISKQNVVPAINPINITCIKGKNMKIVKAVNPTCPRGYKKK